MILSVSDLFFMCSFYIYEIYHYIYYYSYNNTFCFCFCFCFVLFMHFFLILAYFSLVPDSSLFHISDFYLQLFLSVPVSSFRSFFFFFPIFFLYFQSYPIFRYFLSDHIFLYFNLILFFYFSHLILFFYISHLILFFYISIWSHFSKFPIWFYFSIFPIWSYFSTGCSTKHDSIQDDLNIVLIFDIICCIYLST